MYVVRSLEAGLRLASETCNDDLVDGILLTEPRQGSSRATETPRRPGSSQFSFRVPKPAGQINAKSTSGPEGSVATVARTSVEGSGDNAFTVVVSQRRSPSEQF